MDVVSGEDRMSGALGWSATESVPESPTAHRLRVTLMVLEVLLVIGAVGGAIGLMTGGIDLGTAAADLPFESPVLGGVALLLVNALLPAVVVHGARRRERWAEPGHLVVGLALIAWVIVQIAFIGFGSWLQATYLVYGAVIAALALLRLAMLRRHP